MPYYIVDRQTYELHEIECIKIPMKDRQFFIGFHFNEFDALKYIKSVYTCFNFHVGNCNCLSHDKGYPNF